MIKGSIEWTIARMPTTVAGRDDNKDYRLSY